MTTDRITTPFGCDATAMGVVSSIDLSGKRAIITGGSSGIGIETARALAQAGADVTLAVRHTDTGDRTALRVMGTTGNRSVRVGRLDLSDMESAHRPYEI
jgi:NAD(P)-dependent dehydrogenase (short-subunit alcohol dehydrogenase family)